MGAVCAGEKKKVKCRGIAPAGLLKTKKLDANGDPVITMGGGDSGDQGESSNCCIFAVNNALEDYLRCVHNLQYDVKAGLKMITAQKYLSDPGDPDAGLIEDEGTCLEDLVEQMNESELEYPLLDGTKVKFQIEYVGEEGLDYAVPGNVILCHLTDEEEGANHFMELESVDDDGVATMQNSYDGMNHITCPSDSFDEVILNYKVTTSDPEVV
eukprot:gnl/MRDRNA2_/MRDRNA2_81004_c0_seq2.p1 gnl/MRDRNA2_/MRDRNA2_81004_c0~~gnl/MRDRNA2_/MRDRNA2_81004_c0_seq2.p1  ORF type:complete len:212 (-),score=47.51 gnl/MRDRNA2_/MRDRNA2_81004_c0_seq2:283-918(-)